MIPDSFWIDNFPDTSREWLIDGILSPYINILSGQPKVGKSTLATAICLAIINGEQVLGRDVSDQGPVGWMGYDSGWAEELRTRVGHRAKNWILLQKEFDLTNQNFAREFGERLVENNCRLLVIDHLYGFANINNLDINNQLDASIATRGLQIINSEYGIPILLLAQASKGHTGSVAHSNFIKGLARVLLEMSGSASSGKRTLKIIGNEIVTSQIQIQLSTTELVTVLAKSEDSRSRDRDFATVAARSTKALFSASSEDLKTQVSFGKLFYTLGFASTPEAGRTMVKRYIAMEVLRFDPSIGICKGPNFPY